MSGSTNDDYEAAGRSPSSEGLSGGNRSQSVDSLAEWRSCDQVENGTPSTSPPYWDTDDDDDTGPKPSELYGKFTWKIENFTQITKRELRSNAFEVGGYKWYILIYPQGCDVCNHLSLFLCVADHDKLLPGWSHFAQFTIAVVNKDSKKSKYSDTLHRFWKKEHDWGWKKFMELSKVLDGFIVSETLVIKAQVQVIREKAHRPFRCLDCQYRRELVRVYLSNVEQICKRFVEEKKDKLIKLIKDKVRWSSFRTFWLEVDQNVRQRMSSEKSEAILKVVVKHFFIEKEVTSTLVMDSLYSGLKALECQSKNKKGRAKSIEVEEMPAPLICVEKDMFFLVDDVLLLLERVAMEPMPPKDDKGLQSQSQNQNRTKDGNSGEEFNKDSIERDERRLTELGRRTVEIFALSHIFSKIEVAYQEAVALKRQEELIREEEAAGQAESDLKAKRSAAEREKKSKKKQAKQKRSGRKGKDKNKHELIMEENSQRGGSPDEGIMEVTERLEETVVVKVDVLDDVSDISDTRDSAVETLQPDFEDRDAGPSCWDTDASEILPGNEASSSELKIDTLAKESPSVVDDSSSTCSTDSVPSVVMNISYKGSSLQNNKNRDSPSRGKNRHSKTTSSRTSKVNHDMGNLPSDAANDASQPRDASDSCRASQPEGEVVLSLKDRIQLPEQNLVEKQEEVLSMQKKLDVKEQRNVGGPVKSTIAQSSVPSSPIKILPSSSPQQRKTPDNSLVVGELIRAREQSSVSPVQREKLIPTVSRMSQAPTCSKQEMQDSTPSIKVIANNPSSAASRPSSAPLFPGPRPTTASLVSTAQTAPNLSRSVSAAGRLGVTDPLPSAHNYAPSYRNAIMGKITAGLGIAGVAPRPLTSSSSQTSTFSLPCASFRSSSPSPSSTQSSERMEQTSARPGFTFGCVNPEALNSGNRWTDHHLGQEARNGALHPSHIMNDMAGLDIRDRSHHQAYNSEDVLYTASMRQAHGAAVSEEFPHLDIINSLFEDDQVIGRETATGNPLLFNRQYSFPGNLATDSGPSDGPLRYDMSDQYPSGAMRRLFVPQSRLRDGRNDHLVHPQINPSAYSSSQVNSMVMNQWPLGAADHTMLNSGNTERHGFPYQLPDYNSPRGFNGYTGYHPANGR